MKQSNNPWIKSFLSKDEIEQIAQAVKAAEIKTSGEIVPVIVRRSSSIGHIPFLLTLLLLVFFFMMNGFYLLDHQFRIHFSNALAYTGIYVSLILIAAIFYVISYKASQYKFIQRILISNFDKAIQVRERALLEFHLNHLTKTQYKTGILIFISLMERQTVVLGDEAISKKISDETWQGIVDTIINSIKENKTAGGLKVAIQRCGEILSEHFPSAPKNPDELENHLVIKE